MGVFFPLTLFCPLKIKRKYEYNDYDKKIPIPLAGVMLGFAALGNLLQSYSESIRLICGLISAILGILLICKCVLYPSMIKEDMKNPIMASVSGTFPMALMLLSAYIKPYIGFSEFTFGI